MLRNVGIMGHCCSAEERRWDVGVKALGAPLHGMIKRVLYCCKGGDGDTNAERGGGLSVGLRAGKGSQECLEKIVHAIKKV